MVAGIRSRGEVLEVDRSADALLATSRLRIVDRDRAVQPWTSPNGRWVLCYNGEIFNHKKLRERLSEQGNTQRSESDTEVVIEALLAWGEDAMLQFRGEFAFALLDRETGSVLLARDPAGVKPLYWARADDRLHIASEVKALTSLGAPIHEVPPGYIGRGTAHSDPVLRPYIDLLRLGEGEPVLTDVEEAKAALRRTFEDSVRLRVDTDLPVGGHPLRWPGFVVDAAARPPDASGRARLHRRHQRQRGRRLRQPAGRATSSVPHEVISLRPRDISLRDVREAIYRSEATEYGDVINAVVSLKVFERVHARGIKVVLTGDGSDELFGGYDMYAQVPEADRRNLFLHKIRHLSRTELQRVDRTSMGLGVEARVPFLDVQMLLLSMRIPLEMKVRDGYEKWIVREAFSDLLPDYIKARHKNPMSHSSGLHERIRLYKPLFPRIYRSFGYDALGPMRRDFSVVLAQHGNDLRQGRRGRRTRRGLRVRRAPPRLHRRPALEPARSRGCDSRALTTVVTSPVPRSCTCPDTLIRPLTAGVRSSRSTSERTVANGSTTASSARAPSSKPVRSAKSWRKASSARKPVPHPVWWMTATSRGESPVPAPITSPIRVTRAMSAMTESVTRPPAFRSTIASPSSTPRTAAGSTRGSRHATTKVSRRGMTGAWPASGRAAKARLRSSSGAKCDMRPLSVM